MPAAERSRCNDPLGVAGFDVSDHGSICCSVKLDFFIGQPPSEPSRIPSVMIFLGGAWCRGSKPTRRGAPARINMLLSLVGYSGILGVHFFGTFGFTHNGTTFTYFNVIHLRR